MVSTTKRIDARERARQARLRVDAEREERDRKIEAAATEYFKADDERGAVVAQLETAQGKVDSAIRALLELGESPRRVAALLEIEPADVRRARESAPAVPASHESEPSTSGHERS